MTPEMRALILYAYTLGGNTRSIANLIDIDHGEIMDALALAAHEVATRTPCDVHDFTQGTQCIRCGVRL